MKKTMIFAVALVLFVTSGIMTAFAERINDPLVANDIKKSIPKNTTLNFTISDFTGSVNPPAGSSLIYITLTQLPNSTAGVLRLGTTPAKDGQNIKTESLDRLNFVPSAGYEGEAIFTWDANYGSATSPYPSAVVITIGSDPGRTPETETPTESPETSSEAPEESPDTQPEGAPSASPSVFPSPSPTNPSTESPSATPDTSPSISPTPTPEATDSPSPSPDPSLPTQKPLQYEDMLEHWGAYSAGMLAVNGIIIGEEIGGRFYFYPDKILTRIDFITLACSVFDIKTKDNLADNPFADGNVPAYVLRQGIAAYETGLISGIPRDGNLYLNPYEKITRAEAAKILDNGLKIQYRVAEELSFTDSHTIPGWAIQAVTNMEAYGIIKGYEDNTFRPYEHISKAQTGELLYQVYKYRENVRKTKSVFNQVFYGV